MLYLDEILSKRQKMKKIAIFFLSIGLTLATLQAHGWDGQSGTDRLAGKAGNQHSQKQKGSSPIVRGSSPRTNLPHLERGNSILPSSGNRSNSTRNQQRQHSLPETSHHRLVIPLVQTDKQAVPEKFDVTQHLKVLPNNYKGEKKNKSPYAVYFSKGVVKVLSDSTDGKNENPYFLFGRTNKNDHLEIVGVTNLHTYPKESEWFYEPGFPQYANETAQKWGFMLMGVYHVHPGKSGRIDYDLLSTPDPAHGKVENVIGWITPLGLYHNEHSVGLPTVGLTKGSVEIIGYLPIHFASMPENHLFWKSKQVFEQNGYLATSRFNMNKRADLLFNIETIPSGIPPIFDHIIEGNKKFITETVMKIPHDNYSRLISNLNRLTFGKNSVSETISRYKGKPFSYSVSLDNFKHNDPSSTGYIRLRERFDGAAAIVGYSRHGNDFKISNIANKLHADYAFGGRVFLGEISSSAPNSQLEPFGMSQKMDRDSFAYFVQWAQINNKLLGDTIIRQITRAKDNFNENF